MACGKCKVTHYCDRVCQKRDWKQVHKSVCCKVSNIRKIEEAMHICVRVLTLMTMSAGREYLPVMVADNASVLDELFSFEKEDAVLTSGDAARNYSVTPDIDNNYVCNHFRQTQESRRVLFPVWDTALDSLVFVPVSSHFMVTGMGIDPEFVETSETCVQNNDNVYFIFLCGSDDGNQDVVAANTWVSVPGTKPKLCQKVR